MSEIFVIISLAILGAALGSFAVAQVYRIRLKQLSSTKKLTASERTELSRLKKLHPAPQKSSSKNQKPLKSLASDRSKCLACGYTLAPRDLIPIFSWVALRGRCRKCHAPIGATEFLTELTLAVLFPLSFLLWQTPLTLSFATTTSTILPLAQFALWLIFLTILTVLFLYDLRWQLLPTFLLTALTILAVLFALTAYDTLFTTDALIHLAVSILLLSGTYLVLHHASQGRWVGSGDWILALPLAILLSNWLLALLTLFLANLIGSLAVIPSLISKKLTTNSAIPLGPLLIIAFVVIFFAGPYLTRIFLP